MNDIARTPKHLGAIIRRARRAAGLTQAALGERAGLWQETVSRIENGNGATKLETLFDLLAALDLDLTIGPRSKGSAADIEDIF
jgi:HTH-type transcriptional regulator/antitoxin HipB